MISGYFGRATRQAVRNFQADQSLPVTGVVDSATRDAIWRVSCGGSYPDSYLYNYNTYAPSPDYSYVAAPTYPTYPTYPITYPTYYGSTYQTAPTLPVNCGAYSVLYGYNTTCPTTTPVVTYLSPVSGAIGDRVTVYGSGFSATGNTVRLGSGIITNLISPDGQSVSFTVPAQLSGYGSQQVVIGSYPVSVSNAAGATSGTLPFSVTSLGSGSAPSISSVSGPSSLPAGTQGTWTITYYNPSSNYATISVRWGDEGVYNAYAATAPQTVYGSGTQTITFTHAYAQGGSFTPTFTITNANGLTNSSSASVSVTGSSSYGNVTLSYTAPTSGYVGTQVILQGNGFTPYDNTVHFGNGGTQHLLSQNGTQIYYTIPSYVSACDLLGYSCAGSAQQVTPGTYLVYVSNANGTTQTITFTVVQ